MNKKAAQLSSSGNDFWNSASDRALAIGVRPRDRANPIAQHTTSRATCVNGISLRPLLALGAAMPAWADERQDCANRETLLKTEPARAIAACLRLADQGLAAAQYGVGVMHEHDQGVPQDYAEAAR